jgi:hypothetical protein
VMDAERKEQAHRKDQGKPRLPVETITVLPRARACPANPTGI